jgi:hypothetical protein
MSKHATYAIRLNCNTIDSMESFTPQRLQQDIISVNFIVELLQAHDYDMIIVVVDSVTKPAHFISTHTTLNTEGSVRLYLKEVLKHHGLPCVVVLD